jgi:hypothetical protein
MKSSLYTLYNMSGLTMLMWLCFLSFMFNGSCIRIVKIKITIIDYCISANGFPNSALLCVWLEFVV